MSGAHHPNGSSRLELRNNCPGSYSAEVPLWEIPREDTEDQITGRKRHSVAERGLCDPDNRPIFLAELEAVEDRELVESWWKYWDAKVKAGSPIDGAVEQRIEHADGRFGTTDAWLLWRNHDNRTILTVGDLKGQPPTSARRSLQLADYADAILPACNAEVDYVELAFVSRVGTDEWRFTIADFREAAKRVIYTVAASVSADAQRIPGAHCDRCLAADSCGARAAVAVRSATLFDLVSNPVSFLAGLDPERRTTTLDALGLASERLAEAEKAIKEAIRAGTLEVPLYKMTPTTRQAWRSEAEARATLTAQHPDKAEDLTPLCSPSEAAKALGKNAVEPLTERRPGTPSVRRAKSAA